MNEIQRVLKQYFGYDDLKKEQYEIIQTILAKKDCIGILPTGYGKSITYQISAVLLEGISLVVTPLIALMQDQVMALKKRGYPSAYLNSTQSFEEQKKIYQNLSKFKLLYVSAERLENPFFLKEIMKYKVSMIVCDEAHTVLWGEDFRKAFIRIPLFIKKVKIRPVHLALTATATDQTIHKICQYFQMDNPEIITVPCDRKNIFYKVVSVSKKEEFVVRYVFQHRREKGILYCLTIAHCKKIAEFLSPYLKCGMYYGLMNSQEKTEVQTAFMNGEIRLMICTNAFGMGIDIPDIRYVLLYDMPICLEDFVQQTGRASRDGEYAEAILLFQRKDIEIARYFIEYMNPQGFTIEEYKRIKEERYDKLDKMIEFCLTKKCLHQMVSRYFHQSHKGNCNMCENCRKKRWLK